MQTNNTPKRSYKDVSDVLQGHTEKQVKHAHRKRIARALSLQDVPPLHVCICGASVSDPIHVGRFLRRHIIPAVANESAHLDFVAERKAFSKRVDPAVLSVASASLVDAVTLSYGEVISL